MFLREEGVEVRLYTAAQVGTILALPRRTVYEYAKRGALPTVPMGHGIRFPKSKIDEIARRGIPASAVERVQ